MRTYGDRSFYSLATNPYWGTKKGNRHARLANQVYFNPWYKEPAKQMAGFGIGVINPMENKIPFIPWL